MFPLLFSFLLITVNSLSLDVCSVQAHSERLTFVQDAVFQQTNLEFFRLPKWTTTELKWTVWALIVSHISIHSPFKVLFFFLLQTCRVWAEPVRLPMQAAALLVVRGVAFRWPAGWQPIKSNLACWHRLNWRFATKKKVLCLDSVALEGRPNWLEFLIHHPVLFN